MCTSQSIENDGSGNIYVQNVGDNPYIVVGGSAHLTLVRATTRVRQSEQRAQQQAQNAKKLASTTGRAAARSDASLLDPYRRSIELIGRDSDLAELQQWLESDRPIAVRTMTGPAGAGKTRLATHLFRDADRFVGERFRRTLTAAAGGGRSV